MTTIAHRPLGDLISDLSSLATASSAYRESGSIGPWLGAQLTAFRQLPASVTTLTRQIASVRQVVGNTTNVAEAAAITDRIQQDYPAVAQRVNAITLSLAPVMPKLYAGTYDGDVVAALVSSGPSLIGTVRAVTDLLAKRDQANTLLQTAATNPTLAPDVRDRALQALAGVSWGNVLKPVALLGIGYLVIRSVFK